MQTKSYPSSRTGDFAERSSNPRPAPRGPFSARWKSKGKYGIRIQTFANNVVNEALENRDSFLYHETAGYESGLIGNYQPICQTIFSNYEMVERIETVLDADFTNRSKWDGEKWEAYCRVVLLTLRGYVEKGSWEHSYVLNRALGNIKDASSDLYKLNGIASGDWSDDAWARLRVVVDFAQEAIAILETKEIPAGLKVRNGKRVPRGSRSIYDCVAEVIYETILQASYVRSPRDLCWTIQHNSVWGQVFSFGRLNGHAGNFVKYKVCRLLYGDILEMNHLPNYKGAKILGFCLNVMGLERGKGNYYNDSRALQEAVLIWTRKNFARVHDYDPRVAEACLVDGMTYDAVNHRIVRTYPVRLGQRVATSSYFRVDPAPPKAEEPKGQNDEASE